MEINKVSSKEGLKWKCRQHPKFPCDLICLDGDVKDRVMCLNCAQKQLIPLSNLISMSLILSANEHDILEAYPPLKDYELSQRLRKYSMEQQLEEIEVYFKILREDIENELQTAQQRAKESLIKQGKENQELLDRYMRIADIEKLQKLIVSGKESAEKDLDSFIKEKWSKSEDNRKIMRDYMDRQESKYFSSEGPNRIAQQMIERLKAINFFQESTTQKINLIKSTFGASQQIEITKVDDSTYQLKQIGSDWSQVFIDPILDPLKKYILIIEREIKTGNTGYIDFGLMKDEGKDKRCGFNQYMCYQDNNDAFGISKQIKGNPMTQSSKTGKSSFEVRIHLNEKILRVASLPDYSSIAELDNPNNIDPKVAYRFFFAMLDQGDIMRIIKFKEVRKFDEKM